MQSDLNRRRPKRLLVVSHAGVLDVNRAIFQALAENPEFEVVMIVPSSWRGDLIAALQFEKTDRDARLRIIDLPIVWGGNGSLFFFCARLRARLDGWVPDLIFVDEEPWSLASAQIGFAFRGIPQIFFTKQNLRKRLPPPFSWMQQRAFSCSPIAFAVAGEVADTLRWKGYSKPILDLPHSFDPECFHPLGQEARRTERARLGIRPDALVVGYFGRLTEEKGIEDLLAAMDESHRFPELSHCHFMWVGNGPLAERVKRATSERTPLGGASFHQAIPHDQVGRALALVDILVLPSRTVHNWKEQFGRILVEAMACGAAVIGSDSGEIPHLIHRSGGGTVFRERSPSELLTELRELATDPHARQRYQSAGYQYVSRTLTHAAVARRLAGSLGAPGGSGVEAPIDPAGLHRLSEYSPGAARS